MLRFLINRLSLTIVFGFLLGSVTSPTSATAQRGHVSCCGPITPAGDRLAATLDSMNVESLWLANEHVNWLTGEPDRGGDYEGPGRHTHCSAFAAAAAKKFGAYLLHPPEHGQQLLANAQSEWLASQAGREAGWKQVTDMHTAQVLANRGSLVVVLYQNPDRHVPGHIAIVRPSEKSAKSISENGPEVIQAGEHNHTKISVRVGFENHPGAWPDGVRYYTHAIE